MQPPAGSSSSRSSRRRSRSRSSSRSRSRHRSSSPGRDSSPITGHRSSHRSSSRRSSSGARGAERVIDYKAAFLALQVRNEADAQKKRKRGPAQTSGSTQAMDRGFRMLSVLFGEISMVISAAETYLLDPFPPERMMIRCKLRSGDLDLNESFYCHIFYLGFQGDKNNIDVELSSHPPLITSFKVQTRKTNILSQVIHLDRSHVGEVRKQNTPASKKPKTTAKSVRKPMCEIMNMDGKVTPRSIAYVAVLEHSSLTTTSQWSEEYYGFSYPQMYNFIVGYFEAPLEGTPRRKFVDDLLEWWNKQIFPTHAASASMDHTASSSFSKLREQHRAREAAAAAVAAAADEAAATTADGAVAVAPAATAADDAAFAGTAAA
ncbi:hypothetical protein B0H17DRAFT_1203879 [Mycena rosella]|uniref:Uncharacterized protein n=1 Tax=Mycena rosella TaxID=1033263 RepID=A0AAD7DB29_MYCRO|nr:hypothetical protein B0H17DRAFT_1203879 [Mycena rosella]